MTNLSNYVIVFIEMGRPTKDLDVEEQEILRDLIASGVPIDAIASQFDMSKVTLAKRIADIREKEGILMDYRSIRSLHLTELQCRILEKITPQKIEEATLKELVSAFKILHDAEVGVDEGDGKVKGLLGHLIAMEKQQLALRGVGTEEIVDTEYTDADTEEGEKETMTSLLEKDS